MNKPATNVYPITSRFEYKIVNLTELIQALRIAYVAACKAMGLARKLKNKAANAKHRSRATSLKNKIYGELRKYDKGTLSIFESIAYRGVLINKF